MKKLLSALLFTAILLLFSKSSFGQKDHNDSTGLAHRSFLYVGEWDTRHPDAQLMAIIKDGSLSWKHTIPLELSPGVFQEFDDITMLPNGNIVFARMAGAGIITSDKKIIWEFKCPKGTETHSCIPIGKDSILMALNGTPAKVLIVNTATNAILKEIMIPTSATNSHGQFRHVRYTPNHTILLGLMAEKKVVEIDLSGDVVWSVDAESPWAAVRLKNGNTLISGDWSAYVREVTPQGQTVWEITQNDLPFKIYNLQTANRLDNGNTIICNWIGNNKNVTDWPSSVQAFEITKEKKVVWKLSSWSSPDLGTCTAIQLLTSSGKPDPHDTQR